MYTEDRNAYRNAFNNAWQKHLKKLPLEPFEKEIVAVILSHPEYHALLDSKDTATEFEPEENPFLHMSLHISIREQIRTDRPTGILLIYQILLTQHGNELDVEHMMMTVLANMLWQAQQSGEMPSENSYLEKLKELLS
jgi:hypothetical protein